MKIVPAPEQAACVVLSLWSLCLHANDDGCDGIRASDRELILVFSLFLSSARPSSERAASTTCCSILCPG